MIPNFFDSDKVAELGNLSPEFRYVLRANEPSRGSGTRVLCLGLILVRQLLRQNTWLASELCSGYLLSDSVQCQHGTAHLFLK